MSSTAQWRKSSRSGGANDEFCVEVARLHGAVGIRDSKDPDGSHLSLSTGEFARLLDRLRRTPA